MAGVTGRWAMRALTNECPSSSSSSPPPSAPTWQRPSRRSRRASAEGRQGRAAGGAPAGARAFRGFSGLFRVVRPLLWCFLGYFQGWALPFPAQWSFSSFVRLSLGTPPPSLAFLCSSQSGGVTDGFRFWQLVKRLRVSRAPMILHS